MTFMASTLRTVQPIVTIPFLDSSNAELTHDAESLFYAARTLNTVIHVAAGGHSSFSQNGIVNFLFPSRLVVSHTTDQIQGTALDIRWKTNEPLLQQASDIVTLMAQGIKEMWILHRQETKETASGLGFTEITDEGRFNLLRTKEQFFQTLGLLLGIGLWPVMTATGIKELKYDPMQLGIGVEASLRLALNHSVTELVPQNGYLKPTFKDPAAKPLEFSGVAF